jgi:hypothetical protein
VISYWSISSEACDAESSPGSFGSAMPKQYGG